PAPFRVDSLCLFAEADDGRFRLLHRYTLSG
ncbi:MAG TPA: phosphonate metabolism protein, partial [Citreicella sp.]|nr:phosphonate metabolism protein [Citreicella sp.]